MRALHLLVLTIPLAACVAPPAGDVTTQPAPYGRPCAAQCAVRLVNESAQPLALYAATAGGSRIVGTIPAGGERLFGQSVLSPRYTVRPAQPAEAHGAAAAAPMAVPSCDNRNPRPGEDLLLVCK